MERTAQHSVAPWPAGTSRPVPSSGLPPPPLPPATPVPGKHPPEPSGEVRVYVWKAWPESTYASGTPMRPTCSSGLRTFSISSCRWWGTAGHEKGLGVQKLCARKPAPGDPAQCTARPHGRRRVVAALEERRRQAGKGGGARRSAAALRRCSAPRRAQCGHAAILPLLSILWEPNA